MQSSIVLRRATDGDVRYVERSVKLTAFLSQLRCIFSSGTLSLICIYEEVSMRSLFWFTPLLGFWAALSPAQAPFVLPETVVTASRTAQTVDETLAAVTVLDRAAIAQRQARSVPELLKTVPGVQLVNNGGLGQTSSIFLRGTESDHVLVLIDGVKVGSATAGTTALQYLPVSQIERIEIVRGPRASLYGSEAIGGVIQIFTQRSQTEQLTASAGIGDEATWQLTGSYVGRSHHTSYQFSASHLSSDGYDACDDNNAGNGGCFTIEPDEDGHENSTVSVRLGQQFARATVAAYALRTQGNTEYDSSVNNEVDFMQQVLGLQADVEMMDNWFSLLRIGESRDEADNFGSGSPSVYDTQRRSVTWQNDWFIDEQQVFSVGYDFLRDTLDSNAHFPVTERDNHGIFAQYQGHYRAVEVQLSSRYDDNAQFGGHWTGGVALGYDINAQLRTFVSWGTAFKAPSFNELYFPGFGNPHLAPETADSWELGVSGRGQSYHWSVNGFHNTADELIATSFDAASGSFLPVNVAEATIYGAELSAGLIGQNWALDGSLTALKTEDQVTGHVLPRRAEYVGQLTLSRSWHAWQWHVTGFAQSHRYDDTANQIRLGGYATLDVLAEYRLDPAWVLKAKISNVFDRAYEETRYFPAPDRGWWLSVHYQR